MCWRLKPALSKLVIPAACLCRAKIQISTTSELVPICTGRYVSGLGGSERCSAHLRGHLYRRGVWELGRNEGAVRTLCWCIPSCPHPSPRGVVREPGTHSKLQCASCPSVAFCEHSDRQGPACQRVGDAMDGAVLVILFRRAWLSVRVSASGGGSERRSAHVIRMHLTSSCEDAPRVEWGLSVGILERKEGEGNVVLVAHIA
ncbi:hypothetical protein B0H19DRAFT_1349760 [Mycena capillaripes]|nr:hypothetical protein B0H19DRAFT_1349760 [Mycena capillaripes]